MKTLSDRARFSFPRRLAGLLLALFLCTPDVGQAASKDKFVFTGRGADGRIHKVEASLLNRPKNTVDPSVNADETKTFINNPDLTYKYRRVLPADNRWNCAGDVSNVLFKTGQRGFNVSEFKTKIIDTFGGQVKVAEKNDCIIFGKNSHIAVVVGETRKENVVVIRSKDNQGGVLVGTIDLNNCANDPNVERNGPPTIWRVDPSKITVQHVDPMYGKAGEAGRDAAKDAARTASQNATRDATTRAAADAAKDAAKEAGKNASKTASKDASKSSSKDAAKPQPPMVKPSMCFVAGTLVHTPSGVRKIEDLKVDDQVLSFNERTARIEPAAVTRTWKSRRADLLEVCLPGGSVTCSQNHRFYTSRKRWLPANLLQPGEKLMLRDPARLHKLMPAAITATPMTLKSPVHVYNISVADHADYFAGPSAVLCHNVK